MSPEQETWSVQHFTQANPPGPGQDDVPALFRRVAATLEALGPVEVQDAVFHWEVAEEGDRPTVTVYLHRGTAPGGRRGGERGASRGLSRALRRPWTVVTDAPAALGRLAWPSTWPARRRPTPPSGSSTPGSAD